MATTTKPQTAAQRKAADKAKAERAKARVDRYAAAKKAAKAGKDPAKVLARPLPTAPRGARANAAVPEWLEEYRGSAPAGITQEQATREARKLSDEGIGARLLLIGMGKGKFKAVERNATLTEAARRFGVTPPRNGNGNGNGRKAPAAKAPAARAAAKKAPAKAAAKQQPPAARRQRRAA